MSKNLIKHFLISSFFVLSSYSQSKKLDLPPNIKEFIGNYCVECHNAEKKKGGTRLDNVSYSITQDADAQNWKDILDVMNLDEMPPKKAKQPTLNEKSLFIGELTESLEHARSLLVDSGGEVLIRYMNKREYQNVIKDLLGVEIKVDELPFAPKSHFDTMAKNQHFSSIQFETYNKLAEHAIKKMFADEEIKKNTKAKITRIEFEGKEKNNKRWDVILKAAQQDLNKLLALKKDPSPLKTSKKGEKNFDKAVKDLDKGIIKAQKNIDSIKKDMSGPIFKLLTEGAILGSRQDYRNGIGHKKIPLGQLGTFNYKIRVASTDTKIDHNAFLQIEHGHRNDPEKDLLYHFPITGTVDKPSIIEFSLEGSVDKAKLFRFEYYSIDREKSKPIWLDWLESDGPYFTKNETAGYKLLSKYNLDSIQEKNVKSLISEFAGLAFRHKTASPALIEGLYKHFQLINKKSGNIKESVIKTLAVTLTTPHFLYISEYNDSTDRAEITDLELAHRLSFFLWSSLPDERLLQLAKSGELKDKKALSREIDRMLLNKKAENFYNSFISQWLDIWKLDLFEVTHKQQRSFFYTKGAIEQEPKEFFKYLVRSNDSALKLLESDFVIADPILARYYDLNYPKSNSFDFEKIQLPNGSQRGGILGQASVLAITSRVERTSPIDRGAYILRKLLNSPPPEPPANVPEADFNAEGKTMRQILELHQSKPQCSSCHKKIDPLGFAMESFDQFGIMRDKKELASLDTKGKMPDGKREFNDFSSMKKLIVDDKDQFITGLSKALLSYALGRGPSFTDQELLEQIVASGKSTDYSLRNIIKEIVYSKQFTRK